MKKCDSCELETDNYAMCEWCCADIGDVKESRSPLCYSSERTDTDRVNWLYSKPKGAVKSNAMVEIELGIINGEYPTHIELREAIDKCMDE